MSCFVFIWQKRLPTTLRRCAFLIVFVGFSFVKSFNIFVGEGHESLAEFWAFFLVYCSRPLQAVSSYFFFLNEPSEQRSRTTRSMGKPLSKVAQKKARDVAKADWPYFHM